MPSDHADHIAASTAGYIRTQVDRGAGAVPRYISRYEKPMVGAAGDSGHLLRAEGHSQVSQAAADTQALAALNGQRGLRYGKSTAVGVSGRGGAQTVDVS